MPKTIFWIFATGSMYPRFFNWAAPWVLNSSNDEWQMELIIKQDAAGLLGIYGALQGGFVCEQTNDVRRFSPRGESKPFSEPQTFWDILLG